MPFKNEHAARIINPEKFEEDTFRSIKIFPGIRIIMGKLKGQNTMTTQTYRFDAEKFTTKQAKEWLKSHKVNNISFEEAINKMEKANKLIEEKVLNYLKKNPAPKDETQFHKFAETVAKEHGIAEEAAYKIIGDFISKGKSKGNKNPVSLKELAMGIKVEMEHTNNKLLAEKIARDHLSEFPDYYSNLKTMEDKMKKPMKKSFMKIFDNLFVKMDKADKAGPHKYIKRMPKPTGKGYIYFYNQQQVKDYKEKGVLPTDEKKTGGILTGIMSFFGFKDEKQAQEKVKQTYEKNKDKFSGVKIEIFTDYMNEYLSNKDKWDKRLQKKEIITKDKNTGKVERAKTDKKDATVQGEKGKKWNLSIMRNIAGIVGSTSKKEEKVKEPEDKKGGDAGEDKKLYEKGKGLSAGISKIIESAQAEQELFAQSIGMTMDEIKKIKNPKKREQLNKQYKDWQKTTSDKSPVTSPEGKKEDFSSMKSTDFKDLKIFRSSGMGNREKIGEHYYDIGKEESVKPENIKGGFTFGDYNFAIVKEENSSFPFKVIETKTGLSINGFGEKTMKGAVEKAQNTLKTQGKDKLKQAIDQHKTPEQKRKEAQDEEKSQKEGQIAKDKEAVSEEKKTGLYGTNAKKFNYGKMNLNNIKNPYEKKLFQTFKPSNLIHEIRIPKFDYNKEAQDAGVWSDGRMMIIDKKITDEIYNTNKQKLFNKYKKQGKSDDVAIEEITKQIKDAGNFPNWKQIIPREDVIGKKEAEFTGNYHKNENKNAPNMVEYSDGERTSYFNPDYIATIKNKFPNATFHLTGEGMSPAVFKVGNEIKAILMPMRKSSEEVSKLEKAVNLLLESLEKAKKMPVGTVSRGFKKVADGKWVPVDDGGKPKKEPVPDKKDKKKDEKKPEIDPKKQERKEKLKSVLKKVASIFADALSERDPVAPAAQAVEETGENVKKDAQNRQAEKKQKEIEKKRQEQQKKKG